MGNDIKCHNKKEIFFKMIEQNACCLLEYKLPLRYKLPYCHWMYATFDDNSPILLSLIYLCLFLDGLNDLEKLWIKSYSLNLAFAYPSLYRNIV